ncbi:MAG: PilT/PilU family type 4a pilus ATPase [Candidatus Omnitrophota bacterium]
MEFAQLITRMFKLRASTVHIAAGISPLFNIHGRLVKSDLSPLDSATIKQLSLALMNKELLDRFKKNNAVNFICQYENIGRFRVSFFRQRGDISGVIKSMPESIPSFEELNLPQIIKDKVLRLRSGLVVITGPSGCGKSTTLAVILNLINTQRPCHIVTLEDPIEYFFEHKMALISQREIGLDTHSYPKAIREATRQDADIIMIGEMRDMETIDVAMSAAESGCLVLATMPTADSVQTIYRIVTSFPSEKQQQVYVQMAETLQMVISQQLVMHSDGKSRVPAVEVMVVSEAVRNLIRNRNIHQIPSAIESGNTSGMQSLDQALHALYEKHMISELEVITKSVTPAQATRHIGRVSIPQPENISGPGFLDVGEEIMPIDKKMIKYKANLTTGQEGYWTSSLPVVFNNEGMVLSVAPGLHVERIYVSDFNIVGKKTVSFELARKLLLRFKLELDESDALKDVNEPCCLEVKIFTQPETAQAASYNKINLKFPLQLNEKWHTWVINIPQEAQGKMLKISMFEFPNFLTRVLISDIIFF